MIPTIDLKGCTLFKDSPDTGLIECICSKCGKQISEEECPIRLFMNQGKDGEMRFHIKCFEEIKKDEGGKNDERTKKSHSNNNSGRPTKA